jgi:hypothetical protein
MSLNQNLYMSTDDYLHTINRAHSAYMKSRLGQGNKEMHIADLAIESTNFFEVAYHVLDTLAEKAHQDSLYEIARKKYATEDFTNHIEPEPEPKSKKKRGKK